ncbi:hypothetical protein LTS18_014423 [Coniosporium uncinatum]|uniref:Uncharacterized protein n=1 Tax=Coniosporium uncinatum TaxID=93489 RepID=A0ACC3D8M0_9PEZI|nr:hypothetical protein LTS18_014423 [Coniosporium uncinatum]
MADENFRPHRQKEPYIKKEEEEEEEEEGEIRSAFSSQAESAMIKTEEHTDTDEKKLSEERQPQMGQGEAPATTHSHERQERGDWLMGPFWISRCVRCRKTYHGGGWKNCCKPCFLCKKEGKPSPAQEHLGSPHPGQEDFYNRARSSLTGGFGVLPQGPLGSRQSERTHERHESRQAAYGRSSSQASRGGGSATTESSNPFGSTRIAPPPTTTNSQSSNSSRIRGESSVRDRREEFELPSRGGENYPNVGGRSRQDENVRERPMRSMQDDDRRERPRRTGEDYLSLGTRRQNAPDERSDSPRTRADPTGWALEDEAEMLAELARKRAMTARLYNEERERRRREIQQQLLEEEKKIEQFLQRRQGDERGSSTAGRGGRSRSRSPIEGNNRPDYRARDARRSRIAPPLTRNQRSGGSEGAYGPSSSSESQYGDRTELFPGTMQPPPAKNSGQPVHARGTVPPTGPSSAGAGMAPNAGMRSASMPRGRSRSRRRARAPFVPPAGPMGAAHQAWTSFPEQIQQRGMEERAQANEAYQNNAGRGSRDQHSFNTIHRRTEPDPNRPFGRIVVETRENLEQGQGAPEPTNTPGGASTGNGESQRSPAHCQASIEDDDTMDQSETL